MFEPTLDVVVELRDDADAAGLRSEVLGQLEDLVADLRLAADVRLAFAVCDRRELVWRLPYRVRINGRWARLPLQVDRPGSESVLAAGIHANRGLLLSPSLCDRVWAAWVAESPEGPLARWSSEGVFELLSRLVRRGSRIDRAREWHGRNVGRDEKSVERSVEEIAADPDGTAIELVLSKALAERFPAVERWLREWDEEIFADLGLILPSVKVHPDERLGQSEFRVRLNDLRWPRRRAAEWNAVALELSAAVSRNAGQLLTTEVVECSMNLLSESHPELVHAARQRFDVVFLTRLLRDLADEGISVRDYRTILEGLLAVRGMQSHPGSHEEEIGAEDLSDYVSEARCALRHSLTHRHRHGSGALTPFLLDAGIERRLAQGEPVAVDELSGLIDSLAEAYEKANKIGTALVVLTSAEVGPPLRRLVGCEFPSLVILAYQELVPDVPIQPLGRLTWS